MRMGNKETLPGEEAVGKWLDPGEFRRLAGSMAGALLFAVGTNFFMAPAGLYTGGVVGFCQVIRTLLVDALGLPIRNIDISGILYYLINIPILLLTFTRLGKKYFAKTMLTVSTLSLFLAVLPTAQVVEDVTAASVIGGIISGVGVGLILRMGSSAGGSEVVGLMVIQKKQDFSVGRMNLLINAALYAVCLFLFDVETVIYSVIFAAVYSVAIDKVHIQNINVEVKVVTKIRSAALEKEIFEALGRGITKWESMGAYTGEPSQILYVLSSKYEVPRLKAIVHRYDPNAFIVVSEGVRVDGNFLKKL